MIIVAGGAGFIGSNLLAELEASGRSALVVCDRLGSGEKWRNIAKRNIATIIAPDELISFLDKTGVPIEAVFHLTEDPGQADVDVLLQRNYHDAGALWAWCAGNGIRLIYASTAETYGDGREGFDDDIDEAAIVRLRPSTARSWTRHLFDQAVARTIAAGSPRPPQWAGLKMFDVYGPNEYHRNGDVSLPLKAWRGTACLPDAKRDHTWVGDCVAVMVWLLDNPDVSGLFNLGTGNARSTMEVIDAVGRARGATLAPGCSLRGDGYQYFTQATVNRLRASGYATPFTSLEEGIARYVGDFLASADPYL